MQNYLKVDEIGPGSPGLEVHWRKVVKAEGDLERDTWCLLFVSYRLSEEDRKCLWARLKYNCEAESVLYLSNRFSLWGKVCFLSFQVAHRTRGFITTNPCFIPIYFGRWPPPPLLSSRHWFTSSSFHAIRLSWIPHERKRKGFVALSFWPSSLLLHSRFPCRFGRAAPS